MWHSRQRTMCSLHRSLLIAAVLLTRAIKRLCGCEFQVHQVFKYEFHKSVRIRDARLGCMYYFSLFVAIVYIVRAMLRDLSYLKAEPVDVDASWTLMSPSKEVRVREEATHIGNYTKFEDLPYCCNDKCEPILDPDQKSRPTCFCANEDIPRTHCAAYDGDSIETKLSTQIIIRTMLVTGWQEKSCTTSDKQCSAEDLKRLWKNTGMYSIYLSADLERFTVRLRHSMVLTDQGAGMSTTDMNGFVHVMLRRDREPADSQRRLCSENSDAVTEPFRGVPTDSLPCFIPIRKDAMGDILPLKLILDAMGITLDQLSEYDRGHLHLNIKTRDGDPVRRFPLRMEGFFVDMVIHYFNARPWYGLTGNTSYYFEFRANTAMPYSHTEAIPEKSKSLNQWPRKVNLQYGIAIRARSTGFIGSHNLNTILLTFSQSLVMIACFTVAINFVGRHLMRFSKFYYPLIYYDSGNLKRLGECHEEDDEDLVRELKAHNLEHGGTHRQKVMRIMREGYD